MVGIQVIQSDNYVYIYTCQCCIRVFGLAEGGRLVWVRGEYFCFGDGKDLLVWVRGGRLWFGWRGGGRLRR